MKRLVLIDGFAMMFRAFYAVKFAPQHNEKPVGAVFGCATTILQVIEQFEPDFLVIAIDAPEKTFRHEMDENYKAQRTKAPDEFTEQIPIIMDMIDSFGITKLIKPGFEADDIIGTLSKRAEKENIESYILSGDLDFLQLISDKIHLAKFNGQDPLIFNREKTFEKLGVYPEQVIDYKAICGDSSDNYKGVPGIGPKTCTRLLSEYKNLEAIYENLDQLKPKVKEKFIEYREYALHCQKLATIHPDVPVEFSLQDENLYQFDATKFHNFFNKIEFNSLHKRVQKLNKEKNNEQVNSLNKGQMGLF